MKKGGEKCFLALLVVLFLFSQSVYCQGKEELEPGARRVIKVDLPKVWEKASGRDVLAALEVARQDGIRKLIERIYGLKIDAETSVYDLVLENREIESALQGELIGMREKEIKYFEDGSCQLRMELTIEEVIEVTKISHERVEKKARPEMEKKIEEIKTFTKEHILSVWGSGALPASRGLAIIRAQRAAELDVYRKFSERLFGIKVYGDTTVADFVLAHDNIQSNVAATLNGVRFTDVRVTEKWVEVDGEVTLVMLIETVERSYKKYVKGGKLDVSKLEEVKQREEKTILKETGRAAIEEKVEALSVPAGPYYEEKSEIRRVLEKKIVIE